MNEAVKEAVENREVSAQGKDKEVLVYVVQPCSLACNQAIVDYLAAMSLADESKHVIHYRNEPAKPVWEVPYEFIEQLHESRKSHPDLFRFRAFKYPAGDKSRVKEVRFESLATSAPMKQAKRDLARMIKRKPGNGRTKKSKR